MIALAKFDDFVKNNCGEFIFSLCIFVFLLNFARFSHISKKQMFPA